MAGITRDDLVMQVNLAVPAKTVTEFIAYAKAAPGKINMASGGNGAPSHVAGELFKMMAGVDLVHVPYRGAAPALTDLLGGQVQLYFGPLPASIEHIKTGRLRALAVTTATRAEVLPDLPTMGEFCRATRRAPGTASARPENTPAEIVERLNREINAGLADPEMSARLDHWAARCFRINPPLCKFIADETEKWGKVVKFAGLKAS